MRGEHRRMDGRNVRLPGSSPHARGTRLAPSEHVRPYGIIPACAGNTKRKAYSLLGVRDHPRMRGEHRARAVSASTALGSSPHARGTRMSNLSMYAMYGIIPACAGNTPGLYFSAGLLKDHPRMRGEHWGFKVMASPSLGSSPHARGTLHVGT